jgi:hypothetical protein
MAFFPHNTARIGSGSHIPTYNMVARCFIFIPQVPIWEYFGRYWNGKMLVYFMTIWNIQRPFSIFYGRLCSFGIFWYVWTKKNLASLAYKRLTQIVFLVPESLRNRKACRRAGWRATSVPWPSTSSTSSWRTPTRSTDAPSSSRGPGTCRSYYREIYTCIKNTFHPGGDSSPRSQRRWPLCTLRRHGLAGWNINYLSFKSHHEWNHRCR